MKVTVFGSGYVGLVTGACLADAGNHVLCVDVDADKIERLKRGEVPIHEPGLERSIRRNSGKPGGSSSPPTPTRASSTGSSSSSPSARRPDEDGSADLRTCSPSRASIGEHMNGLSASS